MVVVFAEMSVALIPMLEFLHGLAFHRPDVVVMDIRLPGRSGIDACRDIVSQLPDTRVIMLTSYAEDELLFDAIEAGACGYVLKQIGSDDLIRAIEAVGRGEALLDPSVTRRVLERVREAARRDEAAAFAVRHNLKEYLRSRAG